MEADCPIFQCMCNWNNQVRKTELGFVQLLNNHLKSKIKLAKAKSVKTPRRALSLPTCSNTTLSDVLEEVDKERKARNKARKKRKAKNQAFNYKKKRIANPQGM